MTVLWRQIFSALLSKNWALVRSSPCTLVMTAIVPPLVCLVSFFLRLKFSGGGIGESKVAWPDAIGGRPYFTNNFAFNVLDTDAPASAFDFPIGSADTFDPLDGPESSNSAQNEFDDSFFGHYAQRYNDSRSDPSEEFRTAQNYSLITYDVENAIYAHITNYSLLGGAGTVKPLGPVNGSDIVDGQGVLPAVAVNFSSLSYSEDAVTLGVDVLACAANENLACPDLVSDNCLVAMHARLVEITAARFNSTQFWRAPDYHVQMRPREVLTATFTVSGSVYSALLLNIVLGCGLQYVAEKTGRMRQRLAMAGAAPHMQVLSWLLFSFCQSLVGIVLLNCLLHFTDPVGHLMSGGFVLVFSLMAAMHVSLVAPLVSSIFRTTNSFIAGCLILALLSFVAVPNTPEWLPVYAIGTAYDTIKLFFSSHPGETVDLSVFFGSYGPDSRAPEAVIVRCLSSLLWTSPICFALGLYLEKVLKNNYSQVASVFFPVKWLLKKLSQRSSSHRYRAIAGNASPLEDEDDSVTRERIRALSAAHDSPLVVDNLRVVYPSVGARPAVTAVRKLTFAVSQGECFGLCGANGSGKSTTIECMSGGLRPTSGTIFVNNLDIKHAEDRDRIGNYLGVCPQHDSLYPTLSAMDHFTLFTRLAHARVGDVDAEHVKQEALNLADRLGLVASRSESKKTASLSGGQRRRVSVGLALASSPSVIILDEPSTGVDPKTRRDIWALVADLKRDHAVVLTSHDMAECEVLCDRVCIMQLGAMKAIGTVADLNARVEFEAVLSVMPNHDTTVDEVAAEVIEAVDAVWPGSERDFSFDDAVTLKLPRTPGASTVRVFKAVQALIDRGVVRDLSLSSASLHDAFIATLEN